MFCKNEVAWLSDIGDYLSGIFAPVALLWFIASYKLQTKELELQRKELSNSVKAQQGAEEALQEQVNAMKEQTNIMTEQFRLTLESMRKADEMRELGRPHFKIEREGINYMLEDVERINSEKIFFKCIIPIMNIGSKADIIYISIKHPKNGEKILTNATGDVGHFAYYIEAEYDAEKSVIVVTSNFEIRDELKHRTDKGEFQQVRSYPTSERLQWDQYKRGLEIIRMEYLQECSLKIISESPIYGIYADNYLFEKDNNGYNIELLNRVSQSYSVNYTHSN